MRAAVLGLILVALAVRWPTLAGPSFWVDEWVTRHIVSRSLLDALRDVKNSESTPPLYYLIAWTWAHVFGASEFALRSLSGLFGAATVPVAYAAGRVLASRRAGLIAASFVAVNPLLVWYSAEARAYSLLVLLGATTVLFVARALAEPTRRTLTLWTVTGLLALATHYFAAFLLAAEALVLLSMQRSDRRRVYFALAPIAATGILLLPLAYVQQRNGGWIADLPFTQRIVELPRTFAIGVSEPSAWFVPGVAFLLAAAFLLLLRVDRPDRRTAATALALGSLTVALPVFVAPVSDYVLTRNLLVAWFPLALAVAIACGARRAGALGLVVAAGLSGIWLAADVAVALDGRFQRANWSQAARLIGEAPRDRLVVAWPEWGASPLGDDLDGVRRLAPGDTVRVAEIAMLGSARPSGRSCWSGAACNMSDVRPRTVAPLAGFSFAGRRESGLFEVLRFQARRPSRLTWEALSELDPRYGLPAIWLQRRGDRRE